MMTDGHDVDLADLDFLLSPQNVNEDSNGNSSCQSLWAPQKTESPKKVDQLVKQILQSATERQILEQRLQEFQQRAETIRHMYENEKHLRLEYLKKYEDTERKYASVDHELVVKSLELEQLRAQCAESKPPPFEYKLLVSKYIKLAQTLNEMQLLQFGDLNLLKQLQKYCQEKGIKIPLSKLSKSPRKRVSSDQTCERGVQCDLLPLSNVVKKVNASTQYISTVSTRGTNTDIIKKSDVSVMHGCSLSQTLPKDLPNVDVMMSELLSYDVTDRSFLSPLKELIILPKPTSKSTACCTDLCNIKRNIEYATFKPIVDTKVAGTQTTKTLESSALNHSQNLDPQLFNKLWNTFGCMVYALMSDEQQRTQDVLPEEKFSATMGFNKDTLKAWLSQACGLPFLTTNNQANYPTLSDHNYSEIKFDAVNKTSEEFEKEKNKYLADVDVECMEVIPNEIIVLDALNIKTNERNSKKKRSNRLATKEYKRLKHLKKCKQKNSTEIMHEEEIAAHENIQITIDNEYLPDMQDFNKPKFVNNEKSEHLSDNKECNDVIEKRKSLQHNEHESETKKLRLTPCIEEFPNSVEDILEINFESPKLVIDFDKYIEAEPLPEVQNSQKSMVESCVEHMTEAFENNQFAQLQDEIIRNDVDESDITDETGNELEIAEPDNINDCRAALLHTPKEIPLDLKIMSAFKTNKAQKNCLMYQLAKNYSAKANKLITGQIKVYIPSSDLRESIITYIKSKDVNTEIDIENDVFKKPEHLQTTAKCKQIVSVIVRFIRDLSPHQEPLQQNKSMQAQISKLIVAMQKNNTIFNTMLVTELEQTIFNPVTRAQRLELVQLLNLTALYLLIEQIQAVDGYSARLFIAKALYYYNALAIPMINMVLQQYPTALPHREDRSCNAMDPLVNVIQHLLMCTKYDMDNSELQHRDFLSKLRFEYHYEPFQPNRSTVLNLIFSSLHTQRYLEKIPYALALLCKRWDPQLVVTDVIQAKLLPLINSWRLSEEFSGRLAVMLESLSLLVKPFPLQTDVSVYLCIFEQFITYADKNLRECAVRAILRFQRFGYVNCFNSLLALNVNEGQFEVDTLAMLRTFIHRKPLSFWQSVCPDIFSE